jgi:hypothetical protein
VRETKGNFLDEAVTLQIRGPTSPANVGFWPEADAEAERLGKIIAAPGLSGRGDWL